jgi:L-asparaginase
MQAKNQKIVVLGTGGTIAGESNSENEGLAYQAAQRSIQDLIQAVAGKSHSLPPVLTGFQIESEQVSQIDSKDMDFALWHRLALRCDHWLSQADVHSVVITHGTDTLEETAYFLSQVVQRDKPIVLTCAMRPANFKDADGPQNMRDALNASAQLKGHGVWLVAAGEIQHSQYVQKVHPTRLNAFDSGEFGPAAVVRDDQIVWHPGPLKKHQENRLNASLDIHALPMPKDWPWVGIILNHVQTDVRHVHALIDAGIKGLVVAGTGNGSISQLMKDALLKAQGRGVAVCLSSRCNQGLVIRTANHAFETAKELNPAKARVALILNLLSKQQSHVS